MLRLGTIEHYMLSASCIFTTWRDQTCSEFSSSIHSILVRLSYLPRIANFEKIWQRNWATPRSIDFKQKKNWISTKSSKNIFVIYLYFNCKDISFFSITMNGYRASGLRKKYSGPPLHGSPVPDQKDMTPKGAFRQASHTIPKKYLLFFSLWWTHYFVLKWFDSHPHHNCPTSHSKKILAV